MHYKMRKILSYPQVTMFDNEMLSIHNFFTKCNSLYVSMTFTLEGFHCPAQRSDHSEFSLLGKCQ